MKKLFFFSAILVLCLTAGVAQACVDLPEGMPMVASAAFTSPIPAISPGDPAVDSNSTLEFVHITGGCYCMGLNPGEGLRDTSPSHQVCIDDYYMGKYEVTQGQWREIMGSNPSTLSACGDDCPVVDVSWNEVQEFIHRLSERTGKAYRLPTEAEWEYAVLNGGTQGTNQGVNPSGAKHTLHPVGTSGPNSLGIHDMLGSVWEWTSDWYSTNYYKGSPRNNPEGPSEGIYRVLRGGAWVDTSQSIQPTTRVRYEPWIKRPWVGFRLISPDQYSAKFRFPVVPTLAENAEQNQCTASLNPMKHLSDSAEQKNPEPVLRVTVLHP